MSLSRLTDRIDPAAVKVAIRAAIFMPLCFLLASLFLGDAARPFAAFGSFILLAMVSFAGPPLPRFIAWTSFVLVGCVFITLGTWLSQYSLLAAVAAGLLSFVVFFSGVISPYFAAARSGAVLLIALPVMVEAEPAMIDDRLTGWLLACAICIPATYLVWRLPWFGELRRQSARCAKSLAALIREPSSEDLRDEASVQVWKLRRKFLSTPNRPTGATGVSAAIANLVDEQAWTYGLVVTPGGGIEQDRRPARALREATAGLLDASAGLLEGESQTLPIKQTEQALEALVNQNTADLKLRAEESGGEDGQEAVRHLDHEFRLRKLAYSAIDVAETSAIASETKNAPGALGDLWTWADLGRREVVGAGRMLARHAGLDSSWLRNSIRAAIGIGVAVFVADLVAVQNAFWVVLGTLSILRSNALGTRGSVVQALAGTLVGIVIGSAVIWLFGEQVHILWVALPLSVLFASYAQRAISFTAGQAGFALLVMVLYNLIEPVGWQVGLVRIQDVAIGCGVSLLVGLLIWPRGAAAMIRGAIGNALVAGAELVRQRSIGVLEGHSGNETDQAWADSVAASELLDSALRRFLDESTGDQIDRESLVALCAAGLRLRRTAHGIGQISDQPWYRRPGKDPSPQMLDTIDRACDAYVSLGEAVASQGQIPSAPDLPDPVWLLPELERDFGAGLSQVWLYENLQYLSELYGRFEGRATMLFEVSSENPPPTGDAPMPDGATSRSLTATASAGQSG